MTSYIGLFALLFFLLATGTPEACAQDGPDRRASLSQLLSEKPGFRIVEQGDGPGWYVFFAVDRGKPGALEALSSLFDGLARIQPQLPFFVHPVDNALHPSLPEDRFLIFILAGEEGTTNGALATALANAFVTGKPAPPSPEAERNSSVDPWEACASHPVSVEVQQADGTEGFPAPRRGVELYSHGQAPGRPHRLLATLTATAYPPSADGASFRRSVEDAKRALRDCAEALGADGLVSGGPVLMTPPASEEASGAPLVKLIHIADAIAFD